MELTRRDMVGAACAAAAMTLPRAALGGWEPSERYPDPAVKSLDPSFNRYRLFNASIERMATGMRWCEGPAWFGDARCLIWSDIPNNALMRWDEETGAVGVYRKPSNHANGNTRDRQGRLISCEHETRRITPTEYDGSITVLMDRFAGKRLNSPNDVSVKSDDSIWFSDPVRHSHQLPRQHCAVRAAVEHLSFRPEDRTRHGGGGHARFAERRGVFARREQMLHRGQRPEPAPHLRVRRRRRRHPPRQQASPDRCGAQWHARRLPCRHGRQPVVRLGHGQRRARWGQGVQSRGPADRLHCAAGALRQPRFRWAQAQPPVHDRESLALFALRECARCEERVRR